MAKRATKAKSTPVRKKKATTKQASKPAWCSSRRKLAELLGVSHTAVNKWVADPRWTFGDKPNSKWVPQHIEEWRKQNILPTSTAVGVGSDEADFDSASLHSKIKHLGPAVQADVALKLERRLKVRLEREIIAGNYLRKDEVEAERVKRVHAFRQGLLALPKAMEMAEELDDFEPDQREVIVGVVAAYVDQLLHRFANSSAEAVSAV